MIATYPPAELSRGIQECSPTERSCNPDWGSRGEAAYSEGKLQEAKHCFEKALQISPFDAKIHNNLSVVLWSLGNVEDALGSLTRALELDPNDQDVILNCAEIFKKLGKKDDAREIIEGYLSRNPWDQEARKAAEALDRSSQEENSFSSADLFNQQGEYQFSLGKNEHARVCFEIALEQNPNHAVAHSNLGIVLWEQGDLTGAMEHFYQALELDPHNPDILSNSARALAAAGHTEIATELLKLYLQQNPQDEAGWEDYATLVQQSDGCIWSPDGISPEVSDIYLRMGKALAKAKDFLGAAEAFRRSVQLRPQQAEPLYQLGRIHLMLGQQSESIDIFKEALDIDPCHKPTALELSGLLSSQDRTSEAELILKDYLAKQDDTEIQEALNRLNKS